MTIYDKCTCVKVNREKMDLIKKKGLNLQDVLDKAMDNELKLNKEKTNMDSINQLSEKINKLTVEKEEKIAEYNKKINIIVKLLTDAKEHEEKAYDEKINYLSAKKDYLEKM